MEQVENELQAAQSVLTEAEFVNYTALIQEQIAIYQKSIKIINGQQEIVMERLTSEETTRLEQIQDQLTPLKTKIDNYFNYSLDEAAKKLSFPVKRPDYVPAGYELVNEEFKAKPTLGSLPIMSLMYKQTEGEFGFIVRQSAILTEENDEYSLRLGTWDHEESYDLDGNQVKYASEGKNVTMMKIIVPEKGTTPSYQIFIIADILSKEEVEKIALSLIK